MSDTDSTAEATWGFFDDDEPPSPLSPLPVEASTEAAEEKDSPQINQYLVCDDVKQSYAISVANVREITTARTLQPLPSPREKVMGVMSIRGALIPMMDTCHVFAGVDKDSIRENTAKGRQCIVVCEVEDKSFGIFVKSAEKVLEINSNDIRDITSVDGLDNRSNHAVNRICTAFGKPILIVDVAKVL